VHERQIEHPGGAHLAREQTDETKLAGCALHRDHVEARVPIERRPDQRRTSADLVGGPVVALGRSGGVGEGRCPQQSESLDRVRMYRERSEKYEVLAEPLTYLGRTDLVHEALHRSAVVVYESEQCQGLAHPRRSLIARGFVFDAIDFDIHQRGEMVLGVGVGPLDADHATVGISRHDDERLEEPMDRLIIEPERYRLGKVGHRVGDDDDRRVRAVVVADDDGAIGFERGEERS
jgi:hypothetical protein